MNVLLTIGLMLGPTSDVPFKCGGLANPFPGYEPNTAIMMIDDQVLHGTEVEGAIQPEEVEYVDFTCWNPTTGEFGKAPAIPIIRVLTKAAAGDPLSPALAALEAQVAILEETGEYATSLDRLGLSHAGDLEFRWESDGESWSLSVLSRFQRCDVSSEYDSEVSRTMVAREACGLRPEEQSQALRKALEAVG